FLPRQLPAEVPWNSRDPFLGDDSSSNEMIISQDERDHNGEDAEDFIAVGLKFSSLKLFELESIESFYASFARKRGFTIKKGNHYFSASLKTISRRKFACSRHGQTTVKQGANIRNRRSTRTGCRARLYISLIGGCWIVKSFGDNHNHPLLAEQEVQLLPYHRIFDDIAKQRILQMRPSGMQTKNIREMLRIEMNNLSIQSKDIQNFVSGYVNAMKKQDAQLLLDFFQEKQQESPSFVYKLRIDEQPRLTDALWIDSDAKSLYRSFSDVVVFDTTYSVNAYKLSFAPFVSLDNNGLSILFGCALIHSETVETFEWLFREWSLANDGIKPSVIMTDQCPSMSKAIAEVVPATTKHFLCTWHIYRKFYEKFSGPLGGRYNDFVGELKSLLKITRPDVVES
ncbi:hypothetical protein K3495_g13169, partial [Podosphaera aphanis]